MANPDPEISYEDATAARDDVWVCPGLHYLRQMVEGAAEPFGISPATVSQIGAASPRRPCRVRISARRHRGSGAQRYPCSTSTSACPPRIDE